MAASIDPAVHAERLRRQLLAGPPARDATAVAERLLAVQGQDARGVRLAVRARSRLRSMADIDRALTGERSVVISWLNRGTLHLVRREDYPWLQALTTPPLFTGNARRLAQEGVTPAATERGVAVVERSLAAEGPLTRAQLGARVAAAGVRTEGQALVHVLMLASLRGLIVRGPMAGVQHAYALVRDWLGPVVKVDRDRALAELARRYLAGHGPAGARDLARWAGLPLRDARAGLEAIASELRDVAPDLVDLRRRRSAATAAPARLLGAYDPVLLGWTSRAAVLGEDRGAIVAGGLFRPFAIADGRAVARWSLRGSEVMLEPLGAVNPDDRAALERDGTDVVRFLGLTP